VKVTDAGVPVEALIDAVKEAVKRAGCLVLPVRAICASSRSSLSFAPLSVRAQEAHSISGSHSSA
jgi:hypothetical protein